MNYKITTYSRENPVTATVATTATRLTDQNPNRCMLIFSNLSVNFGFVAPRAEVSATVGMRINTVSSLILLKRDHYDLVTREWWALNDTLAGTWWVLEEIMIPDIYQENDDE